MMSFYNELVKNVIVRFVARESYSPMTCCATVLGYFMTACFLVAAFSSQAQTPSCAQSLRLARATYDQGRLHEVPQYLESCTKSAVAEERVEAYKLLCLTYIYLEEPEKADDAMLNLLRTNHYFKINSSDPAEFVALWKTFRRDPIYRLGAKLGANATQPNVLSYVPANDLKTKYEYGLSFQGGVAAEIPVRDRITFNPELIFALKQFGYSGEIAYTELETEDSRDFQTTGMEKQTWVSVPLSVQYALRPKSKFNPYASLGVSVDYLLASRNLYSTSRKGFTSLDEQSEDITSQRNKINISAIGTFGGKYEVTGGFLVAEVRYAYGITKANDIEDIYANFNRMNGTRNYVDGVFKLNTLSVTIGYVYNVFKPVKLKR